jgi:nicotinamidase-related amidase
MNITRRIVPLAVFLFGSTCFAEDVSLELRTRVQAYKAASEYREVAFTEKVNLAECAVVLCDIWDKHWCDNATKRCDVIAKEVAVVVDAMRKKGAFIVHCPSDTMDFYKTMDARHRMKEFSNVEFPKPLQLPDPPLPIDDKDGGCDDANPVKSFRAWSRQHAAITIDGRVDGVSDNGQEVWNALKAKKIKTVFIVGVHTNMCILNRGFSIKQMTRNGIKCILVRDLTDAMYNPKSSPFVTHDEGTQLVIEHIEKHWCPTCLSKSLK